MIDRASIQNEIALFRNRMNANGELLFVTDEMAVFNYAVYNAYRDMQTRTIKGHDMVKTAGLRERLSQLFVQYFEDTAPRNATEFDDKHKKLCDYFLTELNKVLLQGQQQEYGKAQKVINMTFKYLNCFDDADKYEEHFKFCHMPIDSYTLNWYFENQKPLPKGRKFTRSDIKNWSSLTKKQYEKLKNNIMELLPKETPLLVEFKIWPQEIAKVEEKELAKAILNYLNNNYESYISNNNSFMELSEDKTEQKFIIQAVKRKIKDLNNDRKRDGYEKPLNVETLAKMLIQFSGSNLLIKIKDSLKN